MSPIDPSRHQLQRPVLELVARAGLGSMGDTPEPVGSVWHLAECPHCEPDFADPFLSEVLRDQWAVNHVSRTRHPVRLFSSRMLNPNCRPMRLLFSSQPDRYGCLWSWMCLLDGCRHWSTGHETGQLALAHYRSHDCRAVVGSE